MRKSDIPLKHLDLLEQAITKSFGHVNWILLEPLTRGLSASALYKFQISGEDYIARLDDPQHPHNNLNREYDAMNIGP
jgi:hypothetical protein